MRATPLRSARSGRRDTGSVGCAPLSRLVHPTVIWGCRVRYFIVAVPLLCAACWTLWKSVGNSADPASAAVWASSIAGFAYLATLAITPNLSDQIDGAAERLKAQLAGSDSLRKTIVTLTHSLPTALENLKTVADRTTAILTDLQRMKADDREALKTVLAERDRAQKAEAEAVAGLQQSYCTVWRLAAEAEPDARQLLEQVRDELDRSIFTRVGLSSIKTTGVPVDDKLHDVVRGDEPTDCVEPGAVVRIVRPGFQRRGDVLQRAEVVRACRPEARAASDSSSDDASAVVAPVDAALTVESASSDLQVSPSEPPLTTPTDDGTAA